MPLHRNTCGSKRVVGSFGDAVVCGDSPANLLTVQATALRPASDRRIRGSVFMLPLEDNVQELAGLPVREMLNKLTISIEKERTLPCM